MEVSLFCVLLTIMKKILLVFAHPDDESFAVAGTTAKYTSNGWRADLVCATRGEEGERGPFKGSEAPLADIRQKELEKAGEIIGLTSVTFLGHKDGTLLELTPGTLEDKVFRVMDKLKPDVVITFEPIDGVSNHPDHKKIGLATTYAFQKYAEQLETPKHYGRRKPKISFEESEEVINIPKLYYVCLPATTIEFLKKEHVLPAVSMGSPWVGTPDRLITTVIDIKRFKNTKIKAMKSHVSQSEDVNRLLSFDKVPMLSQEHFILRMEGTTEVFMGKNDRVSDRL